MAKLRELNLQGCKGEGLQYILQNCAMMRSLNLGFMAVSNIHCQLIGGNMFHLRSLVLRSTEVTDDGLYEIGLGCKKLEQVFLENCKKIGAQVRGKEVPIFSKKNSHCCFFTGCR